MSNYKNFAINLIMIAFLFLPLSSWATTVLINSSASGYATDGGRAGGGQMDGVFDQLGTEEEIYIRKISGTGIQSFNFAEFRGAYEFQLPVNSAISRDSVESVFLKYTTSYIYGSSGDFIKIYGYSADGQIQLTDFSQTDFLAANAVLSSSGGYNDRDYSIDVTDYFTTNFENTNYVGFVFGVSYWNVFATLDPTAALEITYTETSNVPLPGALFQFLSGGLLLIIASFRKRFE
jgi:hypothetical protein